MKDALDLIKRQEAEIEKMRKVVNADVLFVRRMSGKSQRAKEFIRIKTDLVKAEAIKEFAERLKKNSIAVDVSLGYGKEHYTDAVAVIEIDSLVKEMVGEQE